jgi:hypothetical protein
MFPEIIKKIIRVKKKCDRAGIDPNRLNIAKRYQDEFIIWWAEMSGCGTIHRDCLIYEMWFWGMKVTFNDSPYAVEVWKS